MKSPLLLALTLISLPAFAADPFVGRFRPDRANCSDESLRDARRIYGRFERGLKGTGVLSYQAFTDEPSGDVGVTLGKGSRQCVGTVVDVHGKCTEAWETKRAGNVITSVEDVTRPSVKLHYRTWTRITAERSSVVIEQKRISYGAKPKREEIACRLVRY